MNSLINAWKGAAAAAVQLIGTCRWGKVTSPRATDSGYLIKIELQPEGVASGWLPVLTPMAGPGWGMVCPPDANMPVFIAPDCGDGAHGVIVGMTFNTQAMPPVPPDNFNQSKGTPVVPGEWAVVGKSGAVLRLCDDGTIHIKGDVRIDGSLTVWKDITAHTGNITADQGNITATKGNVSDTHGSLDRLRQNYTGHAHTAVQSGPATTGPTTKPDPE